MLERRPFDTRAGMTADIVRLIPQRPGPLAFVGAFDAGQGRTRDTEAGFGPLRSGWSHVISIRTILTALNGPRYSGPSFDCLAELIDRSWNADPCARAALALQAHVSETSEPERSSVPASSG